MKSLSINDISDGLTKLNIVHIKNEIKLLMNASL